MNFDLLPLRAKRAAFAKMSAADKAKSAAKKGASPKASKKKRAAKKAAPTIDPTRQVSRQYIQTGQPTARDIETLISNYRLMHGKDPSPAQLAKLRRKRR